MKRFLSIYSDVSFTPSRITRLKISTAKIFHTHTQNKNKTLVKLILNQCEFAFFTRTGYRLSKETLKPDEIRRDTIGTRDNKKHHVNDYFFI